MENGKRDLLVLLKTDQQDQSTLNYQVACLNKILVSVECDSAFSLAHELVTRTHITRKANKILKAASQVELKAFEFLVNKN